MDTRSAYCLPLLVTTVLLLFSVLLIWRRKKKTLPLPPGPPGWPLVGNLLQLGEKPNESLFALSRQYGPLMTLSLGMKTTVVVSSPSMAKEFLKTHDQMFSGRSVIQAAKAHSYHKTSVIWGQYGSYWRKLRRISTTELMSAKKVQALQHLRREPLLQMIQLLFEGKGNSVNIFHTILHTALNMMSNMMLSTKVFDTENPDSVEFTNALTSWVKLAEKPNFADFFPWLGLLDLQGVSRELTAYLRRAHKFLDAFIGNRLETRNRERGRGDREAEKDFLDILLELRADDLTLIDIRALIFELLMAGSDTTGATVEWAMAELIHRPHIMKLVQAEVDQVVGRNRRVEESDIDSLPYLHAVVKEVLRLHPAGPLMIPHRADSSCEVAGFGIPKHTQVWVNVWAIGRDPAIWKEPLEFMPQRFLEGETSKMEFKGQDFEFIPFGAGRRICLGLHLADKMVNLILASLVHSFDWTLAGGMSGEEMDMSDLFGVVLKKRIELEAIPTPRLPHTVYQSLV
uniref:CYP76AA66 n=2 Tax=Taxus chinensis TaxID=29808 RepID=A0A291FAT5_TAXCH|nr:CYP76AA66 [Taxus chinensis]